MARARFFQLYNASMDLKNASDQWRFPADYFDAHHEELGTYLYYATNDLGGARMLMVIAGENRIAYAQFLGSNGGAPRSGLDETLYWFAAEDLRRKGYVHFHLGGGRTSDPNDSLLFFKSGFSDLRHPLFSYKRIFDCDEYRTLEILKTAEEVETHGRASTSKFFPTYRREFA
jgi:hypothetical protein